MPLTDESPDLYYRRGDWYGFTCMAEDYQLTQIAFGFHIYFVHVRDKDGAWRRWRPDDPLPEEARQAGTCLAFWPELRSWFVA